MNGTAWRWFPAGLVAAMATAFIVNGVMVYDAYKSFPGVAGADGFDLSNQYKQILVAARQQDGLGWQVQVDLPDGLHPALRLRNRDGAPLHATLISARAERPVGPVDATLLNFQPAADGTYQTDASLSPGQWDIMLTIVANGQPYSTTRRIVVK
jgi:nitrogen fixation protein FixH